MESCSEEQQQQQVAPSRHFHTLATFSWQHAIKENKLGILMDDDPHAAIQLLRAVTHQSAEGLQRFVQFNVFTDPRLTISGTIARILTPCPVNGHRLSQMDEVVVPTTRRLRPPPCGCMFLWSPSNMLLTYIYQPTSIPLHLFFSSLPSSLLLNPLRLPVFSSLQSLILVFQTTPHSFSHLNILLYSIR